MLPSEEIRVAVFLAAVLGVYWIAVRALVRRLAHTPAARWQRRVERVALVLAAASIPCILYGFWVEPYWPEVTRIRIPCDKLAAGDTSPIRIVQISDLHSDPKERLEGRLPELVARERPDLIVFTGDSINSVEGLPVFRRCLARLSAIAPTFAVRGNWDAWAWPTLDLFAGTGARELDGQAVPQAVRGSVLWIVGIGVGHEDRLDAALSAIPPGAASVFLYHYPDLIPEVRDRVDVYCAGHTHGGQVALPFYGALVTLSRFGKRYEAGLYREGRTFLYTNRGIGMEGGPVPRVRFCARPEITVIELAKKAS